MSGIILRHKSPKVVLQWYYILDNMVLFGIKGYHRKVVLDTGKDGRESTIYCREKPCTPDWSRTCLASSTKVKWAYIGPTS